MAIPAADTDLLIVIRAIQETITDTKIPGTQAETHPLSELLTISDTALFSIHFVVSYVPLFETVYITQG